MQPFDPEFTYVGIAVMGFSSLINWMVSSKLIGVAKESESIALECDGYHLRADVYTSIGVFIGLIFIHLTSFIILDTLISIGVAVLIIRVAHNLFVRSYQNLIDHRLTDDEEMRIKGIIQHQVHKSL